MCLTNFSTLAAIRLFIFSTCIFLKYTTRSKVGKQLPVTVDKIYLINFVTKWKCATWVEGQSVGGHEQQGRGAGSRGRGKDWVYSRSSSSVHWQHLCLCLCLCLWLDTCCTQNWSTKLLICTGDSGARGAHNVASRSRSRSQRCRPCRRDSLLWPVTRTLLAPQQPEAQ